MELYGLRELFTFIIVIDVYNAGFDITDPSYYPVIDNYVKILLKQYQNDIKNMVFPTNIGNLFKSKKKNIKAMVSDMCISGSDLDQAIHTCQKVGYDHESYHYEFVPQHLKNIDIGKNKPFPQRKIKAVFDERKMISVHIFFNKRRWHCFYFSQNDMKNNNNHWRYGPHLHYSSSEYTNITKNDLVGLISERKLSLSYEHIKFDINK